MDCAARTGATALWCLFISFLCWLSIHPRHANVAFFLFPSASTSDVCLYCLLCVFFRCITTAMNASQDRQRQAAGGNMRMICTTTLIVVVALPGTYGFAVFRSAFYVVFFLFLLLPLHLLACDCPCFATNSDDRQQQF